MIPREELKRRILLKRQAIQIHREELCALREHLFFREAIRSREKAMSGPYSERLSREVDALLFLIDK